MIDPALSLERIQMARETLTAAFGLALRGELGAIGQEDPAGVFSEAKRNLTAMIIGLHGPEAWQETLAND